MDEILSHLIDVLNIKEPGDEGGGLTYIDEDEILEIKNNRIKTVEPDYCRPWHKLNKTQKMNRLIIHSFKLTKEYNLKLKEELQLKQLIKSLFNTENCDYIDYDESRGLILNIRNLQRASDGAQEFYLASPVTNQPKETITLKNTMIVPLSLTELLSVNTPAKKKILIKRKVPQPVV
jgi:hypothetical protein